MTSSNASLARSGSPPLLLTFWPSGPSTSPIARCLSASPRPAKWLCCSQPATYQSGLTKLGISQVVIGVGRLAVRLDQHDRAERPLPDQAPGVLARAGQGRDQAGGQIGVEGHLGVVADEVEQLVQLM